MFPKYDFARAEADPISWRTMHLQLLQLAKGNQTHSTSIFMLYLHLPDLFTTLSVSSSAETNTH